MKLINAMSYVGKMLIFLMLDYVVHIATAIL
jgi:hypothetical protein